LEGEKQKGRKQKQTAKSKGKNGARLGVRVSFYVPTSGAMSPKHNEKEMAGFKR